MKDRFAIIDLGTNTFHLLIAEKEGHTTHTLHREKQPVKIGLAGINDGVITEAAIQRALDCLKAFRKTMDESKVREVMALGTSALRSARNGKAVIARLQQETGIDIKLITGQEEAQYIYQGVRAALELGKEKSLIIDIGGGSVEFIIANDELVFWKQSVDIGAQRLLERYQKHDPILAEEIHQLEAHLGDSLRQLFSALDEFKPVALVGSSGTFDTLSEIYCHEFEIEISPDLTETPLSIIDFYDIHQELITKNREERLKIPGMIEMRVDMIVVASCLIKYILDQYRFEEIRVSTYSLKEGVLEVLSAGFQAPGSALKAR